MTAVSALGVAVLAVVTTGWLIGPAKMPVRILCVPAALLLLYLQPLSIAIGAGFAVAAVVVHLLLRQKDKEINSVDSA